MGKLTLHQLPFSAPCRAVHMLADVMSLDLENKNCDLMAGEHLKPEYLKINPHHTVPTLVDEDGFSLYESRAILTYLVSKYGGEDNSLYPKDLKKRALVDQALQFDGTALYPAMGAAVYPVIKFGTKLNTDIAKLLDDKLTLLNDDLGRTQFAAGNELTVADLSLMATWTSIEAIANAGKVWKIDHLTNIHAWVKRVKDTGRIKNWDKLVVETSAFYGKWIAEKLNA